MEGPAAVFRVPARESFCFRQDGETWSIDRNHVGDRFDLCGIGVQLTLFPGNDIPRPGQRVVRDRGEGVSEVLRHGLGCRRGRGGFGVCSSGREVAGEGVDFGNCGVDDGGDVGDLGRVLHLGFGGNGSQVGADGVQHAESRR